MNRLNTKYSFFFVSLWIPFFFLAENSAFAREKPVNYGVKIGLNALTSTNYDVYSGEEKISDASSYNKNGYLANVFFRINLGPFFMQPEISWNYYRQSCSFSLPTENATNNNFQTSLKINSSSIKTNVITGYYIKKRDPYAINFYVGTSFYEIYKTNYNENYSDYTPRFNYVGILGVSMNISRLYFDFRYEINHPNTNLYLNDIPGFQNDYKDLKIKKNENIISFSCGLMF